MQINLIFKQIQKSVNQNQFSLCVILILLSVPLYYDINSSCVGLLLLATCIGFRKGKVLINQNLLLPIGLYFLMLLSVFWTIDLNNTIPALSKELSLLIIPVCYMLFGGFSDPQKNKIIQYYSYGMLCFCIYYLLNAIFRYSKTANTTVFFYHQLVTKDVNAIHVSVFMVIAFFYFYTKTIKNKIDFLSIGLLSLLIFLLSSKNIILVFIFLVLIFHLYYSKTSNQLRLKNLVVFSLIIALFFSYNKIKNRFQIEFQTKTNKSINANVVEKIPLKTTNVSIKDAWYKEKFLPTDFFPGTAFRVYQFRIFLEMISEDAVFWTGYGLNASYKKIEEKGIKYNLYLGNEKQEGYQKKNFHNQFVQNFADLGFFGFLVLVLMLVLNLKNGFKNKNFMHISFSILMISLFLTETFLWRQRGVVFFTIMYCLFNMEAKNQNNKILQNN
jgi:O-antigen ligase